MKQQIQIKVANYYGVPAYYSMMPQSIFEALENAFLNGEQYAEINKSQFENMIESFKIKMK